LVGLIAVKPCSGSYRSFGVFYRLSTNLSGKGIGILCSFSFKLPSLIRYILRNGRLGVIESVDLVIKIGNRRYFSVVRVE
jgi:hypothetical protein